LSVYLLDKFSNSYISVQSFELDHDYYKYDDFEIFYPSQGKSQELLSLGLEGYFNN
jgi:hypothetical protein